MTKTPRPTGTVERFDPATGSWVQMEHPAEGGGMDCLGTYSNVQALPKGKALTLRYRIALDASMNAGEGGLSATAVTPEPLVQLGRAVMPFAVSNRSREWARERHPPRWPLAAQSRLTRKASPG